MAIQWWLNGWIELTAPINQSFNPKHPLTSPFLCLIPRIPRPLCPSAWPPHLSPLCTRPPGRSQVTPDPPQPPQPPQPRVLWILIILRVQEAPVSSSQEPGCGDLQPVCTLSTNIVSRTEKNNEKNTNKKLWRDQQSNYLHTYIYNFLKPNVSWNSPSVVIQSSYIEIVHIPIVEPIRASIIYFPSYE